MAQKNYFTIARRKNAEKCPFYYFSSFAPFVLEALETSNTEGHHKSLLFHSVKNLDIFCLSDFT